MFTAYKYTVYCTCIPTLPVTPAQLMRPGIGRNASCAVGDCLTSRPKGRSQPGELCFSISSLYSTGSSPDLPPVVQGWAQTTGSEPVSPHPTTAMATPLTVAGGGNSLVLPPIAPPWWWWWLCIHVHVHVLYVHVHVHDM